MVLLVLYLNRKEINLRIILFDYETGKATETDSGSLQNNGRSVETASSTSAAVDTRPYLSDSSLPFDSMILLSVRNILLLWFLFWFAFKIHFSIRNNIKKYHKTVGGVDND